MKTNIKAGDMVIVHCTTWHKGVYNGKKLTVSRVFNGTYSYTKNNVYVEFVEVSGNLNIKYLELVASAPVRKQVNITREDLIDLITFSREYPYRDIDIVLDQWKRRCIG